MTDGKIKDNGRCDDCHPDEEHGQQGDPESNAIIENPMSVNVDDPALSLPRLQADRTEVLAAPFHVAQGTQESPAMIARNNRLFLGMIEAAGLITHQTLARFAGPKATRKGGKHIDLHPHMTGRA